MRFRPRRAINTVRRDYAIRGYLAEHGPCPAVDIAEKLHYPLEGLVMDLAVLKAAWKVVGSDWENDVQACTTQTMPAQPPAIGALRRVMYWLVPRQERNGTPASHGGSFWDDLNRRLEDPGFHKAYVEHFLRIQATEVESK